MLFLLTLLQPAHAADIAVGSGQTYTTILDAINVANDGDRILIDPGTYAEVAWGDLNSRTLTFEAANGAGTVTVETADNTLIDLDFTADVTWRNLDFDGQDNAQFALVRRSSLTVDGSTVTGVTAGAGAAIDGNEATLVVTDTTFQGSSAGTNGGLLDLRLSSLTMSGGVLADGNTGTGSAIDTTLDNDVALTGTTVRDNTSTAGPVVNLGAGTLTLDGVSFTGNSGTTATIRCGGTNPCTIQNSVFDGNSATDGGMVVSDGGTSTQLNDNVVCRQQGGGRVVHLRNTSGTVRGNVFYDLTGLDDALMRIDTGTNIDVVHNTFAGNSSSTGGHMLELLGTAMVRSNLVAHNAGGGPAILASGGSLDAAYNLFFDNTTGNADIALNTLNMFVHDPLIAPVVPSNCDTSALIPDTLSPAIDGGDPAVTDPDGSPADIGAFTNLVGDPLTDGDDDDGDGFSGPQGDCNDNDASVYPGAPEIGCDGIDQDCNPATTGDTDNDGDGVSACEGDCDDTNPNIIDLVDVYFDGDRDGYGRGEQTTPLCGVPANGSLINGDCDDTDPNTYPGALEIPEDQKDNDCDGSLRVDNDGDGVPWADDCDDLNANRFPDNPEIPGDGKDQDCDGWDGELAITGSAGFTCAGCATGSGPITPVWLLALLPLFRRRD